jgi:hypothetical protein
MTENTLVALKPMLESATPDSLLARWLDQSTDALAPTTRRRYGSAIAHFLAWFARAERRPLTLADLYPITLAGYRGSLQDAAAPAL